MIEDQRIERVPVWEVLKRQPRQVVLSALLRMPEQAPGYIVGAWIFSYGTTVLGMSRNFLLIAVITQTVLGFLWVVVAGHLSDRVGRKNMFMLGALFMGVYGFVYVGLLNTGIPRIVFIAVALSLLPVMTQYGPEAALIAESFTPRLRYCGCSLGYQLASVIAGGAVAIHRDVAVRHLSLGVADRRLYRDLCRYRHRRDGSVDRLHQQGHFNRICWCLSDRATPGRPPWVCPGVSVGRRPCTANPENSRDP